MQDISLKNTKVLINEHGAELKSFNIAGREIIWQTDPSVWKSSAPVLFPIVGMFKDNRYFYDGNSYTMTRHGFARDSIFKVSQKSPNCISFSISDTDETIKRYPFKFEFIVNFELVSETKLEVEYKVINRDVKSIYFSLGSHPAINMPLVGTQYEDYYIEFEQKETIPLHRLVNGLLEKDSAMYLNACNTITLSKNIFDNDALIFIDLKSRFASLKNKITKSNILVNFGKAPDLGIWAKPGADYVCIEPWFGYNDLKNSTGYLNKKAGIISLDSGKIYSATYSIEMLS